LLLTDINAQTWQFEGKTKEAYDLTLNLQIPEALVLLGEPQTAQENYVASLAQALELILTEDPARYELYYPEYENRLGKRSKSSLDEDLFLQAEIRLQWAFVHAKFGHEIDAAWNLRQAYLNVQDCKRKFPDFGPIKKTSAVLEILIGAIPDKYNWVLSIMGMEGSIKNGLEDLQTLRSEKNPFQLEANLLLAIIQGYVLHKTDSAVAGMKMIRSLHPENALVDFLTASLMIKNAESDEALPIVQQLEVNTKAIPLTFSYYLKGEIYLQKADYLNSITSFRWFINNYTGQNCIKDAWYKIGLCYWLNGNSNDAREVFKQAKTEGKENAEADKYAARCLVETELPNIKLSKVRYYTDGGFYVLAQEQLNAIHEPDIPTTRDKVEFAYRTARLNHNTSKIDSAVENYKKTIALNGNNAWYFAPNACLQLGYIFLAKGDTASAKNYFQGARDYPRHEYKNSIDSKAKSALSQLSTRI
jgi:tetratricopeptide (TPR) repeat protein